MLVGFIAAINGLTAAGLFCKNNHSCYAMKIPGSFYPADYSPLVVGALISN
jgi:hypothetical protein